jgi:hypothetical protein
VRDLIATYSTFLQWVIKLDRAPVPSGLLDSTVNLVNQCSESIRELLNVVLEDEFVWAWSENGLRLQKLSSVKRILDFLDDRKALAGNSNRHEKRIIANRMFTLSWHNSWMANGKDPLNQKASKWVSRYGEPAMKWIESDPDLIDENLQYHWCHFITQRAVWMRDWCSQEDPNEFERRQTQIEEGSKNPNDNENIARIARAIIANEIVVPNRMRNMLLLIGTRAMRLPNRSRILGTIEHLMSTPNNKSNIIKQDVLQAIFELARHGFLESWSEGSVKTDFPGWCLSMLKAHSNHIISSWTQYRSELQAYTHLDLLPRSGTNGWKDVIPVDWHEQIEKVIS